MTTRGEFGEASSSSSRPRSSSSPLQTPWNGSQNFNRHHNIYPGESSSNSSMFCHRSSSDFSLSSYLSNGLCSSEDGSSQFASPPHDGMITKHYNCVVADDYNLRDDLGLCENLLRLNIGEEEEKTRYVRSETNQLRNLRNYQPNDGGFRYGASSGFGVDTSSLFPNSISNSRNLRSQRYEETLCPEISYNLGYKSAEMSSPLFFNSTSGSMGSSADRSMTEPFIFDNSLIMEAMRFSNYTVPSMVHQNSSVGTFYDDQESSIETQYKTCDIKGYVYLLAKDQHGCRLLQKIFEDATPQDVMIIFNEVLPHVVELMMDSFGNYLIQKLLDVCNEEQRTQIILMVTAEPGQLVRISSNSYGTRVVQRLVESIKTKKQFSLVKSALRPGFLTLIRDLHGNHVIQRCLECLSAEDNEFIFEDAAKFCMDIATHRHGCCVLQKCIAYSTGQQREKLITVVSRNSFFLAQDPYGNYAVQFVIELRDNFSSIGMLLAELKGHYVELSMQKFSSHVVQRCLKHCPESRTQIVLELISVPHFDLLIQDPFANFVIQDALTVTKGSVHAALVEVITPHSILRNNPYCKRIFSRNLLGK